MSAPTPRTDAAWVSSFEPCEYRAAHTARTMRDECEKMERELAQLSEWQAGVIARAERAEVELANIRALADRRNERDHSQDTTHQLVAALDQALDIAQAELKAERARLDWIMSGRVVLVPNGSGHYVSRLHYPVSRAAIDAAMKEETK